MPNDGTKRIWSAEEIEDLRRRANALIGEGKPLPTKRAAADEAGMAYQTLAAWLNGAYPGDNAKAADDVERWLTARATRQATLAKAPQAPRFVPTPTVDGIMATLAHAQHMPDFVVIVGPPGIGKTVAACQYKLRNPNVTKIVGGPSLRSPAAVLDELAYAMNVQANGRMHMKLRAICSRVQDKGALIIVDESNFLSTEALEQLRVIHDQANCGIALVGNPHVFGRLAAEGNHGQNAQIDRRVGVRLRPKVTTADIDALLDAWAVQGDAERALLRKIGRKPGALGKLTKVLRMSHLMAAQERAPLSAELIRQAYAQLDGSLAEGEAA